MFLKIILGDGSKLRRRRHEDDAARCWAVARKLVLGLALTIACQSALAQAMYRINAIGGLPGGCTDEEPLATGFNGAGQVTGVACTANGDGHAFLWKNDGTPMVDLGPNEVGSTSYPYAINASGLVGGSAQDSTGYFAFESAGDGTPMTRIYSSLGGSRAFGMAMNDLGQLTGAAYTAGDSASHAYLWKNDGSPMVDLGDLGGNYSIGYAINASGQVTGDAVLPGTNAPIHTFVWKNDGTPMLDLGTLGGTISSGAAINASGQVAGDSDLPGDTGTHAFIWKNDGTPMQNLGTLGRGGSHFVALNDSGQVTGNSSRQGSYSRYPLAFEWMNDGKPMKDLGTLGTLGQSYSAANDINSAGQVTGKSGSSGSFAFLWRNDGTKMQDLNTLIDPTDPLEPYVTLIDGNFINDSGDIEATGVDSRTGIPGEYLLQGTVLTLNPRSLAFGNQPINTTSAAKSVTMINTSPKAVAITSIVLKGSNPGQFATTNNCGKSMAGHASCKIKVTFKPTTKGAKSESLNVNGGGGGLRVVTLTGTGT
jgi:probable HAF family extracellular repeat protein